MRPAHALSVGWVALGLAALVGGLLWAEPEAGGPGLPAPGLARLGVTAGVTSAGSPVSSAAVGTGSLQGRIVDEHGLPVTNAVLILLEEGGREKILRPTLSETGRFAVGVPAGRHRVLARGPLHAGAGFVSVSVAAGDPTSLDLIAPRR